MNLNKITLGELLAHPNAEIRRHAQGCLKAILKPDKFSEDLIAANKMLKHKWKPIEQCKGFRCEIADCENPAAEAYIINDEKRFTCIDHSL